jgi:hypothetical protein
VSEGEPQVADQAVSNKAAFGRFCDVVNTRDAELVCEDVSHRAASVGHAGVLHDRNDALPAGAAPLTPGLEGQGVGQQHAPMAAAGQPLGRDFTLVEEPHDERPGQPEQLGRLGRGQRDLRREDRDGVAVGQLAGRGAQDLDQGSWQRNRAAVG